MTDEGEDATTTRELASEAVAPVVAPPEAEGDCHESSVDLAQFFRAFFRAKGTREILLVTIFLALGNGCLVGVVGLLLLDRPACM
jgi:hypothetical protein